MAQQFQGIGMTSQRTRRRMVERLFTQGIRNAAVLDLMGSTPRHIFLDEALAHRAYEDTALPIGFNQTLSQPYIVARMTELLLSTGAIEKVLEVGTGSGYQTAVLAQCAKHVFSVERIKALQDKARSRLRALNLYNVQLLCKDGGMGWADKGPYDAIISTAAPTQMPEELLDQLAEGGRLVIPVGAAGQQQLHFVVRNSSGFDDTIIEPVAFVPLLSGVVR